MTFSEASKKGKNTNKPSGVTLSEALGRSTGQSGVTLSSLRATRNAANPTMPAVNFSPMTAPSEKFAKGESFDASELSRLENLRRQAAVDLDVNRVNEIDKRMKELRAFSGEQTFGDRASDVLTSIVSGTGGQLTNTVGFGAQVYNDPAKYQRDIDRLQGYLDSDRDGNGVPLNQAQRDGLKKSIEELNEKKKKAESETSLHNRIYKAADQMSDDSQAHQEQAKAGLGATGQMLVDATTSFGQSMLTGAVGAVTGTGMLPFAVTAFGGATQDARRKGADLGEQLAYGAAQAGKEYLTEKLFGIALPQKIAGSTGSADDLIEKGLRKAVERFVKTEAGQRVAGGIGTWLLGGVTEGTEELIGAAIENIAINPYLRNFDPDTRTSEEKWEEAWYGALVGGVSGLLGVTNLVSYQPGKTTTTKSGKDTSVPTNVSSAAAPEVQQLTQQSEAVQAANPEATVLDAATTMYFDIAENKGKNTMKKARLKADVVNRLIAGKKVEDGEINALNLTDQNYREVFTKLTGVQFPDGKLQIEQLRSLARSAHTVAQQAKQVQAAPVAPAAPITQTSVAERVAQAQQTAAQAVPETDNAVTFEAFVEHAKQYPEYANAGDEVLEVAYAQFLQDSGMSVEMNGKPLSFADFVGVLRSAPDGDKLTVGEMGRRFQQLAQRQNMNKEANYGGQNLLHSEGLSGQPDQRSGGQSRSVPETAGRAEGDGGTRRGDQSGSQAGRSGEVRSVGQNQEGTGSYRTVKVNGNPMTEVRPEAYTPEMQGLVDQYAAIGVNAHIVIEGYPIDAEGHYADGVTIFNTDGTTEVFLQVVGAHAMLERSDHEKAHVVLGRSPAAKEQAIAALGKSMSEKELLDLVNAYLPMYGSAYANSEDLVGDLLEEIICDAYANLNRANAGAPKYHDAVSGVIEAQLQSYSASYGQDVTLTDDAGNLVVESDGNGHSTFSMSTYQDSGRDILTQWMGKAVVNGDLTQQDADDIVNTLDLIYDICEEARGDYAPFDAWSEAKVVVNEQGNPVFSVVKANGDYAMNLDFSLVCKKRRTLDAVLNELVKQGFVDNLALNEKQIVKINDLIRSYGFEVACDLCFVDAKRYRQGKVADDFVKLYNGLVQSMIPKGSGLKPAYFNFGQNSLVDNAGLGIHELPDDQLDFTTIEKVLKEKGEKSVEYKTAMLLKTSPADRKLTMRGDFLSTRGFDELNLKNPRVLKLFNSKKGSGGPKSAVSDVQYLNEVLTSKTFTPEKAYAVGGVRIQSFSDYVPRMVFDYVQMIADLAAKKLPAHAYTKEELFVKQFGLTGMKINMSLIPKVVDGGIAPGLDADGNYAWADESFNFDEAKKIQKADGYSRNCGTIAVGVSDEHIRKLMADPEIRMVIPYHKSGLNPVVAKMNKINTFVNYTDFQNTRRPNGKNGKKLDKDVAADKKLLSEMPDFNTKMRELGDPRAAAEFYVRWCEENGLLPKFDQFAYKTIDGMPVEKDGKKVVDENYYKLLEDFTVYDKGQYVEQTGLTMTFPDESSAFGDMKSLIKRGLSEDALLEAKRDENIPKIVNDIKKMKFSASDVKFKQPVGMQSDIYYPKTRREQHVFDRELANKTSDLKTGDTRGIIITTADNLYFVTARGYMRGEIDEKIELTDANIEDLRKRVGFREKPDGLTENFTTYLSAYWDARRRLGGSVADSDQARSGARDVGLADGEPVIGTAGRSGSPESDVTDPESLIPGSVVFDGENAYTVPQQASEESGAFNLDDYDIEDLLKLSDAEFEKLYAQLGLNTTIDDDILLEDDFDIEDIAEELDEEPEKIEILFRRKGLGDDYVAPEKQAVMTEKRIDERIAEHGAGNNAGYARRYITRISPKDFIDLTVHERNTDRETFDTRVTGDIGSTMKDWDYGKQLTESREPPVLDINLDNGQVIGHNGRHRVRALEMAGIESVEIEVELYQDGYLKKLGAKTIPDLAISSQFDTKIETHLPNLIPLNKAHRDEIMQSYGEKTHTKAKVKYSAVDSSGRLLTEDQQKYFKNAKSRDSMGRLMTMYHGTESFGFTVFDPEFSDDGISLFFTDSPPVARSYSGTDENDIHALSKDTDMRLYQQDRVIHSLKKAFDVLENVGIKKFAPDPVSDDVVTDRVKLWTEETLEEAPNWLAALREHDTEDRRISGLLDAMTDIDDLLRDLRVFRDSGNQLRQAQTMLSISRKFKWLRNHIQHYTDWGLIDEELGEGLVTMLEDSDYQIPSLKNLVAVLENGDDDVYAMFDPELGFTYMTDKMIVEKAQEMQRRNREGLYEVYVNVENPLVVDANYREWNDLVWDARFDRDSPEWDGDTTREIAAWAKEHDYDGVIFRNLVDIGAYGYGDADASDIIIAFKSEQVKSTANEHPTKDPDIRYSVIDSDYMAAVERGDMETAQKMVDEAAKAAGYTQKGYSGTENPGYTVARGHLWLARDKAVASTYGTYYELRYDVEKAPHDKKGVYSMCYRLGKNLHIDAQGEDWSALPVSKEDYPGVYVDDDFSEHDWRVQEFGEGYYEISTDAMADWAKEHGYDSITFENVEDGGLTTVDVVFDPKRNAKSADPVTYDDNGNVIPLSERFQSNNPDIRYSVTPAFEKWYQETYNEELTNSQLKRRLQTAERRAEQAEHNRKAAELKNTFDKEMNLTAWMMHHTKKMREQKRVMNEKLAEARKEKTEAVKAAVAETKEIERAKAAVQHDADRMAERRNAAKRLRIREDAYKQKVTEMKENQKLKRNAARAVLRDSKLAAKRRAEIEAEQGLVDTIRKNPKQRSGVEKLQDAAQALRTLGRSAYRNFVNMAEAIDRFSKRQAEGMRAGTLVSILGGTASTVESMFKKGLVDRAGNRIGDSMSDVFLCWDEAHKNVNEELQAVLQDFMLHRHNIDRMSIVARAESALETFENAHEWLRDMDPKEFARLVAMTEKEAEKSGKQQAQQQAFQYARLIREYNEAQNKPIFADDKGNPVTAETSQKMVDKYIAENPWLLEKANGIYEWWDKFMREWAVGDTISEAEYNRMRQMYPHYVPTYRTTHNGVGGAGFVGNGAASVSKAVKKAKGSTKEVMNIEDSFSNLVSKIVRLNRLNEMYMNIVDTAMLDEDGLFSDMAYFDWDWQAGQYGNALVTGSADIVDLTDTVEETEKAGLEKVGPDEYKLTAWRNGRKYTAYISKDLYQSIGNVTGHLANDLEEGLLKVGNKLTSPMKTFITGINPTFAIRNLSRDLPTAIINSISGLAFPKYYAQAAKEIAQNSEHWQQFQALGGTNATYYNDNKGFVKDMTGKHPVKKVRDTLGSFNEVTEAQTRFAEYLATIDKLGDTYENRLQGIKNSAEVTVDFSRKGRYGKVINAWVPYWNPAVQGIDKTVRSLIESPDGSAIWKQASKTLGRAAMTTILLEAVLQAVLHGLDRDDEWEELNDRTKDTYYCIPLKDSKTFLKIPKNREWGAILGTPFMRMLEYANGRENPFENYIETSLEPNFLPPAIFRPDAGGGFTSDIIGVSQALDLAKNEDFAGRTIVPYSYQQGTLSQQYDSETSWFAKQLGSLLNWSPMQIDYIIGDYFGDFGRMFIQATSKATLTGEQNLGKAALDIVTNPFVADARYSSYAVNKYYDLMDDLDRVVQDRKNQLGTDGAKETLEYQTQKAVDTLYGKAITELNREVREMADGPEKDAAKEQIAQLAEAAVEFYNDSISGKIPQPELTANYANYSQIVSDELIQMNELTKEYNFKPRTSAPESYVDPRNKKNEFVLTEEQQDYYMELYIETYNEAFERMIQSGKYKNAKPERKAEMLEDVKQDVADTAKEELIDWLRKNGIRSTPKK